MKIIATNKKAFHDYEILDTIEAGIVLAGDEVKSLRLGHAQLKGSFAHVRKGELYLVNAHISAYERAYNKDKGEEYTTRNRKLLLSRRELDRLIGDIARKGVSIVPLKLYFSKRAKVKVQLGICKGKKKADKKQALKERDIKRQTDREMRNWG